MNNELFLFFFHLSNYVVIGDIALFLSYPMKFILPFCIIVWILLNIKGKRKTFSLILLAVTAFVTWGIVALMKLYFMIPRPYIGLKLIPLVLESTYSFPSNHAAFFAALASVSFSINKKLGIFASICALLIGLSRIVIGVHTPLDVFAGFCVGIVVSYICIKISKKI